VTASRRSIALVPLAAVALSSCGAAASDGASSAPRPTAPLATAVQSADGVWATVPLGDLTDPTNTFWQLLYRPDGSSQWVDDVDATGTATNGGIALAAAGRRLMAGVEASQDLTFSPVIETRDGGANWSDGLLPSGLTPVPQALAASSASGPAMALLGPPGQGQQIVTSVAGTSDIVQWNDLTDAAGLDRAVPACHVQSIDGVAYSGSLPTVGVTCRQPGVAGIITLGPGGTATLAGPTLGPSAGPVGVLALAPRADRYQALLETGGSTGRTLVVASSDPALQQWSESAPLPVPAADTLMSVVALPDQGFLVLTGTSSGSLSLESEGLTGTGWQAWPTPPASTATVVPGPGGSLSALAANGATVTIWTLGAGRGQWAKGQVITQPVLAPSPH
jgi:hypothetical protein